MVKQVQGMKAKQIILVDDHPIIRDGLAELIRQDPKLAVAGEAGSGAEALRLVAAATPDLVILDLSLPDKDGLFLLKELRAFHANLNVLVLSVHDETIYAKRVLHAGGRGYIMKNKSGENILKAIHHVLAGQIYLSTAMSQTILSQLGTMSPEGDHINLDNLSDRELQVFRLVGQGFQCSEIAKRLHLSPKTIETHCAKIRTKLNLISTGEFRRHAIQWSSGEKTFS